MKTRIVIGACIAVAAMVTAVIAFRGGTSTEPEAGKPAITRRDGMLAPAVTTVEPPQPAAHYDDDPPGTLRLEGQVIDSDDHPVANATVVIDANPPREAHTEADGVFAFDRLTPRSYRLGARSKAGHAGPVSVKLNAHIEPVILRVRPSAKIIVSVTTDAARPVPGAVVELRDLVPLTATTDAAGNATLHSISTGWHTVKVSADGHASAFADVHSTGAAGTEDRVAVTLRAGVAVAGTVVDANGAPIENARVLPEYVGQLEDRYEGGFDSVVTDAKGRWRISGLARETTRIRAYHADHAPGASSPLVLSEGGDREGVAIVLERGARVRGKVVDAKGAPAAGAEVRIASDTILDGRVRRVATDAAGEFVIAGLPRRQMYAVAATEAATSSTIAIDLAHRDPAPIVLRLEHAAEIAGIVVTRSGSPVAEARVVAELAPSDNKVERIDDRLRGAASAIAAIDGTFKITGVTPGSYLVRAIRPGSSNQLLRARLGVPVDTGAANVKIVVDDLSTLTGRVAFADGKSPARFAVQLGASPLEWFGPDATFKIDEVPAGKQFVRITGPDFVTRVLPEVEIAGERATDLGTVTLEAGRTITGVVVDSANTPVAGAAVAIGRTLRADGTSLTPYPDPDIAQLVTGADGRFVARGIGPASYQIAADHETGGRSAMTPIPPGDVDRELVLTLQRPGVVQGFVRLQGKPIEAVIVMRASGTAANSRITVRTGQDGSYRFDRVAPDRYMHATVQVSSRREDGSDGKIQEVTVRPGAVVNLDVDLTPKGVAVVVHLASPGNVVKFGYTTIGILDKPIALTLPRTISEARVLGSTLSSFEIREGMIVVDQQLQLEKIPAGRQVVCASPLRGHPSDPSVMAEMQQNQVDWPIYCKWFDVKEAPDPQHVTVEVQPLPPPK